MWTVPLELFLWTFCVILVCSLLKKHEKQSRLAHWMDFLYWAGVLASLVRICTIINLLLQWLYRALPGSTPSEATPLPPSLGWYQLHHARSRLWWTSTKFVSKRFKNGFWISIIFIIHPTKSSQKFSHSIFILFKIGNNFNYFPHLHWPLIFQISMWPKCSTV